MFHKFCQYFYRMSVSICVCVICMWVRGLDQVFWWCTCTNSWRCTYAFPLYGNIYIICGMVIHLIWDSRTNGCIMLQYLMTFDDHPWTSPNISKSFGQVSCLDLISSHLARTRLAWAVHLPGDLNSATLIYGKTWHWCPSIHCSIILCPKLTEMRIQTLTVCRHTHVMLFVISPIHTPVIN